MIYEYLDIQLTLRCNAKCLNCIKFCNMKDVTGLEYNQSDMSSGQVYNFIDQVKALKEESPQVIKYLYLTGGEPLLHNEISIITKLIYNELVTTGLVGQLFINSNLIKSAPAELTEFVVNFSKPDINATIHNTALWHPSDYGQPSPTFATCAHYRKWRVVLNYQGYSLCCAGDGYVRLFGLEDLIIEQLPKNFDGFPLGKMDMVCKHCPFGTAYTPLEKDYGRPVSDIYSRQAVINKNGRKINKIFPNRMVS